MTTYQYPTKSERAGISRPEPVLNWAKLAKSDYIEIHRAGKAITQEAIDMLALDGSLLWLHQNDGKGRVLFLQHDGLRIYKRPH